MATTTISLQHKSKMSASSVTLCYSYFVTFKKYQNDLKQLNIHSNFGALKKFPF